MKYLLFMYFLFASCKTTIKLEDITADNVAEKLQIADEPRGIFEYSLSSFKPWFRIMNAPGMLYNNGYWKVETIEKDGKLLQVIVFDKETENYFDFYRVQGAGVSSSGVIRISNNYGIPEGEELINHLLQVGQYTMKKTEKIRGRDMLIKTVGDEFLICRISRSDDYGITMVEFSNYEVK